MLNLKTNKNGEIGIYSINTAIFFLRGRNKKKKKKKEKNS